MSELITKVLLQKIPPICDYCLSLESSHSFSCNHNFCNPCQKLLNSKDIFCCPFEECVRDLSFCPIHNSEYINVCANDYTPLCEDCHKNHNDHSIEDLNSVSIINQKSKKAVEKYRPVAELIVEHDKLYSETIDLLHALDEKIANKRRISNIALQMHKKINKVKTFEDIKKELHRKIECYEIFRLPIDMKIALAKYLKDPEDFQHNLDEADKGLGRNINILQKICEALEDLTK